jgi:hypothetical protein
MELTSQLGTFRYRQAETHELSKHRFGLQTTNRFNFNPLNALVSTLPEGAIPF